MSSDTVDNLLLKMPDIAKAVNAFNSEAVQQAAFQSLISAFRGSEALPCNPKESSSDTDEQFGKPPRKPARVVRRNRTNGETSSSGLDEQRTVNSIKEDERFDHFRKKIVLGSASREQQVKFVSWFVEETPITSGNMMRVLSHLGIKMSAPQASTAVSNSKSDFIETPGSKPATFKLSGRAHKEYGDWLLDESATS
ncbi:MAG: hypothetical protein ACTHKQ_02290 [Mesorhizobium sp.]